MKAVTCPTNLRVFDQTEPWPDHPIVLPTRPHLSPMSRVFISHLPLSELDDAKFVASWSCYSPSSSLFYPCLYDVPFLLFLSAFCHAFCSCRFVLVVRSPVSIGIGEVGERLAKTRGGRRAEGGVSALRGLVRSPNRKPKTVRARLFKKD